jgi:hypothetical protein
MNGSHGFIIQSLSWQAELGLSNHEKTGQVVHDNWQVGRLSAGLLWSVFVIVYVILSLRLQMTC